MTDIPLRQSYEPSSRSGGGQMMALIGAVVVAGVGALAWALLIRYANYELGLLAWGIGAAIGFAAAKLGGRGNGTSMACAVLCLASIFGGKLLAFEFQKTEGVAEFIEEYATQETYEERLADAEAYTALGEEPSDGQVRGFLVTHGWVEEDNPAEIPDEWVSNFLVDNGPALLEFHRDPPSFEAWREQTAVDFAEYVENEFSAIDALKDNLGFLDLLFAFLGVSSAYGIVARATAQEG